MDSLKSSISPLAGASGGQAVGPGMRILLCLMLCACAQAQSGVVTYRNGLTGTGAYLHETVLTPINVNPQQFGKIGAYPVDGQVYAQPLYVPSLAIPGRGTHDVVFVATEHNSVYAFDADPKDGSNSQPLWHVSLMDTASGETTVSSDDALHCPSISPEIGITGTPVIDVSTQTLFVVAATKKGESFFHRLHALDITNGSKRPGSPVEIGASVAGSGGDFFSPSQVNFLPYFQSNRAGLLLLNGIVYTSWSSHCDGRSYHGWIIAFDAKTLHPRSVFNSTPNANQGAFWMGGAAPSVDSDGNLFVVSGNGPFDADSGSANFGDSVIKLSAPGLMVMDFFTPFNQLYLNRADLDLGSSGTTLLPDDAGSSAHHHLLVTAGKEGRIYLLDRDQLGGYRDDEDSQIVQSVKGAIGPLYGGPAYFDGKLYFAAANDRVKAFSVTNARIDSTPVSQSVHALGYPGAVPTVSANGNTNGIIWLLEPGGGGVLHAYDATNLAKELYNSGMNPARDTTGLIMRFSVPVIENGRVYVGTGDALAVFGLL